jgi:hypothetical protein
VRVDVATADGVSDTSSTTLATRHDWALDAPLRERVCSTTAALTLALKAALPGDRIILAPGEYRGDFQLNRPAKYQPGLRITIMGSDKTERSKVFGTGRSCSAFLVNAVDGVTFYDLDVDGKIEFQRSTRGEVVECNIVCKRAPEDGDVGLVTFRRHHQITAPLNRAVAGHLVQDCTIEGAITKRGDPGFYYGVLHGDMPGEGFTCRRNTISHFADGIQPAGGTVTEGARPQVTLHSPNVLGTGPGQLPGAEYDVYFNTISNCFDDAVEFEGWCVNGRAFRNRLNVNGNHTITVARIWPGPIFITHNVMENFWGSALKTDNGLPGQTRNVFWYHNTVKRGNAPAGAHLPTDVVYLGQSSETWNIVARNNLLYSTGDNWRLLSVYRGNWNLDFDYNLWFSSGKRPASGIMFDWFTPYQAADGSVALRSNRNQPGADPQKYSRTLAGLQEWARRPELFDPYIGHDPRFPGPGHGRIRIEQHSIEADPMLGPDLRPLPGSPAIDAGVEIPGINAGFAGGAPDLGAYEIAQETPTPSPLPAPVAFEHAGERWTTTAPADWVRP